MVIAMTILGVLCAIVATVLLYVLVLPAKKYDGLNKFFKILHDIFNFKDLWLEKILKFFYVLTTSLCVCIGFFMLFAFETYRPYSYYDEYMSTSVRWFGGYGFLLLVFGPILLRLTYEGLMMFILLVKNTIQINNKLKDQNACTKEEAPIEAPIEAPVDSPVAAPVVDETPIEL